LYFHNVQVDQARMAQEVTAMFQELRTLADRHAELHADRARDAERRARLEMDVAGLQSELDQDRARIADLKDEGEHQAQEIDRLRAELEEVRRPWWRRWRGK
jgi:chromosome segregation ATPase